MRPRALFLGLTAVYLVFLCGRDFWDPDEPRFGQVSREMLQSGEWVVPHFDGIPLALLPPLTYWGSAAASLPLGDVTERTARLPVVLFALVSLAAALVLSPRAGVLPALVLLSSVKFLDQAQRLQADMLLVGSQTWALVAFYRAYTAESRRTGWLLSAYAAVALAVLAKGPLGALLPAATFGLFLLWQREVRALSRMGLWWGVPLVAALVVPWYVAACSRGGEAFCRELVLKQNLQMFFDTWSHAKPFYYYIVQLPWMFLPWTLLLPFALRGLPLDRDHRFLLTWIAFCLVFFSASEAKQAKYILPILTPLSVLVADALRDRDLARPSRAIGWGVLGLCVVGAGVAAVALPPRFPAMTAPAIGVLALGGLAALAAVRLASSPRARPWALAGLVLLPALGIRAALVQALETYKSPHVLVEEARKRGHPVAIHGISYRQTGGLIFYTGRTLPVPESPEALDVFMAGPEPRLAYLDREDWKGRYRVLVESPYRDGTLLVINEPPRAEGIAGIGGGAP